MGIVASNLSLFDLIVRINEFADDSIVFANKIQGKFTGSSKTVILNLSEQERALNNAEIAKRYCSGYEYFLETFIIKEMLHELALNTQTSLEEQTDNIINYAENDA